MIIYTFYSYKGGVGRSMALANVAEWYYRQGLRVVIIDWDLEAPGLENFFFRDEKTIEAVCLQLGVIDILAAYKRVFPSLPLSTKTSKESIPTESEDSSDGYLPDLTVLNENLPALSHSLFQIRGSSPNTSSEPGLWLLSAGWRAGDRFPIYAEAVQSFDWTDFYNSYRGGLYFEWMRQNLAGCADVVLIDSRTGVTEMGGVCTRQLADVVVSLTAPNDQNLEGVARMASSFIRDIPTRRRPAPQIVFVPARIDTSEKDRRNKFEAEFREKLDRFIPAPFRNARTDFWRIRIPYISAYAYEETLAIEVPDRDKDLEESYKVLAAHLAMLAPGNSALRKKSAPEVERIFGKLLPTVFISCRGQGGRNAANWIESRLNECSILVWQMATSNETTTILDQTKHMLFILTDEAVQSNEMRSEYLYARQQGVDVLPLYSDKRVNPAAKPAMAGAWFGFDSNAVPIYLRGQQLYEMGKDWDALVRILQSLPKNVRVPFMAPEVSTRFVDRPEEIQRLQNEIVRTSAQSSSFVLWGPGGSGKSTVAMALCHDDEIIAAFDGGILWTALGPAPDVKAEITKLVIALTGERTLTFVDEAEAAAYLADKLGQRRCLLVIDDVWDSKHLQAFLRGAPNCIRLITTRDSSLATSIGARLFPLGEVREEEAIGILTAQISVSSEDHNQLLHLVAALGRIPLVLKLANAQLKERIDKGISFKDAAEQLLGALPGGSLLAFDQPNSSQRDESVATTISVSIDQLKDEEREQYLLMAYYSRGQQMSVPDAARLWRISEFDAEQRLQSWRNASMLVQGTGPDHYLLPPILYAFVQRSTSRQINAKYEAEFARLSPEDQTLAQAIFMNLVLGFRGRISGMTGVSVAKPVQFFDPKSKRVLEQLVETGLLKQESDGQIALAYSAAATDWKRLTDWIQYPTATSQDIKVGPPLKLRDVASSKTAAAPVPNSPAPPKRYWSLPAVAVIAILVVGIASLVLFKRGRQIDPGAGISSTTLAESLIDSGKLDAQKGAYVSAVSKFTSAIQLVPNSGLAFLGRGSAEISLGKYDSAIHDYTKALELNGQTSLTETYQLRGAAYERAGKFQEAIADYARASELRPDDVKLRNEIERLKKSIGLKATK